MQEQLPRSKNLPCRRHLSIEQPYPPFNHWRDIEKRKVIQSGTWGFRLALNSKASTINANIAFRKRQIKRWSGLQLQPLSYVITDGLSAFKGADEAEHKAIVAGGGEVQAFYGINTMRGNIKYLAWYLSRTEPETFTPVIWLSSNTAPTVASN